MNLDRARSALVLLTLAGMACGTQVPTPEVPPALPTGTATLGYDFVAEATPTPMTSTELTATPIEATKRSAIQTLSADQNQFDQVEENLPDGFENMVSKIVLIGPGDVSGCSSTNIENYPVYRTDSNGTENLEGYVFFLDTSSHCIDIPIETVQISTFNDQKQGRIRTGQYLGAVTFGAMHPSLRHAFIAVYLPNGEHEGMEVLGTDRMAQYSEETGIRCFTAGNPTDGVDTLPVADEVENHGQYTLLENDQATVIDYLHGQSEIANNGLSGGPLFCGFDNVSMRLVGEVQEKNDIDPLYIAISNFSQTDLEKIPNAFNVLFETSQNTLLGNELPVTTVID